MAVEDIEKTAVEQAFDNGEEIIARALRKCCNNFTKNQQVTAFKVNENEVLVDEAALLNIETFRENFNIVCISSDTPPEEVEEEEQEVADSPLDIKSKFIDLLGSTDRPGISDLLNYLDKSDFYIAPASTRYHGAYEGGLLEHSMNVYDSLEALYAFTLEKYPGTPEIAQGSRILAALLHDLCKCNTYKAGTRNVKNEETGQWEKVATYFKEPVFPMGHAGKSIFIIQQFIQLTPQEAQAIFWHMGAFDHSPYNTPNEMTQAYNNNLLAFLLHQADMMSTYVGENERYF